MSPTYRYTAKNWEGKVSEGDETAKNLREALDSLRARNLFVLTIKERSQAGADQRTAAPFGGLFSNRKKPKSRDFMVLFRQFTTMLQAGITVLQILKVQAEQMENPVLKDALKAVALEVEKGGSLSESMGRHDNVFPRITVTMVEAGEAGGILESVANRMAEHFEKQHNIEEKIRSATTYPIIISSVAVVVFCIMVFFVLPQFAGVFREMGFEMPLITRIFMAVAEAASRYWYIFFAVVIALIFGLVHYFRTPQGRVRYDRIRMRFPVLGPVYNKSIVARFCRTLGTLLASGVPLVTSLELVERIIDNTVIQSTMERSRQVIRQGQAMALPLAASGLFPPMMVEMVHVGEESGSLDEMLSRTADFYESEVTFVLDRLGTIIEPVLIIAVGIFVALLMVSIVSPMFQIYEMI